VLEIYRDEIARYGGLCAVRDNNALLSCIVNPQRDFAGRDLYPTLASKAAILVYSMIKNHPFSDGNKRTAFVCGRVFLRMNGYDITSLENYYELILKIADSSVKQEDVFNWFNASIDVVKK
jgi:death-on-curing protein